MRPIKGSALGQEIKGNAKANVPTMIWGAPGIGKSEIVYQVAQELGAALFEIRANLFDPVDVRGGLKVVEQKDGTYRTRYGVPEDYPESSYEGLVMIFIDELPTAPRATQNSLLQLLTCGKIGNYKVPKNTIFVAAGNRAQDRAAVHEMPTPVKSRFAHYTLEPDIDDFCAWAYDNGIDSSITSFLRFRPELLHKLDASVNASPTPRTWEYVSRKMPYMADEFFGTASLVGDGPAGEYLAFKKIYKDIPTMEDLLDKPTTTKVPDSPSMLYAISGGIAGHVSKDNFDNVMKYVNRMPKEYQVVTVKDCLARDRDLVTHKSFTDWTVKNASVFI